MNTHCPLWFSLGGDNPPLGVDALAHPWPKGRLYAFPPVALLPHILTRVREEHTSLLLVAPMWPNQPWFADLCSLAVDTPWVIPPRRDLLTQALGMIWHPRPALAAERVRLAGTGFSEAVVRTIQSSRALSTCTLYAQKWRVFDQWCAAWGHDPFQCPVSVILNFLQELLEKGKAASTIKVYVVAISACHFGIGGSSPGSHPLVTRFMVSVRRIRVPHPVLFLAWDLLVVLRALAQPPFEPLQSVDIRTLSLKTALLVALASAKRVSEIHTLSVHPSCLRFEAGSDRVVLWPNVSLTPKVVAAPFRNRVIELFSFSPSPFASVE